MTAGPDRVNGLFTLNVSFAGTTSGFDIVFGSAPAAATSLAATASVPEPSTLALLLAGILGIAVARRYGRRV